MRWWSFVLLIWITCLVLENSAMLYAELPLMVSKLWSWCKMLSTMLPFLIQAKQRNIRSGLCRLWGMYMFQGQGLDGSAPYLQYGSWFCIAAKCCILQVFLSWFYSGLCCITAMSCSLLQVALVMVSLHTGFCLYCILHYVSRYG